MEEEVRRLVVTLAGSTKQFEDAMAEANEAIESVRVDSQAMASEVDSSLASVNDSLMEAAETLRVSTQTITETSEEVVDAVEGVVEAEEELAVKSKEASVAVQDSLEKMTDPLDALKAEMEATFDKMDKDLESIKEGSVDTTDNMEGGFSKLPPQITKLLPALKNVNLGLLGLQASVAVMVSKIAWEVGHMISDWIAGIEEWEKSHAKAVASIAAGQDFLLKKSKERFDMDLKLAELAANPAERKGELAGIRARTQMDVTDQEAAVSIAEQELQAAKENNTFGIYGLSDDALAEANLAHEKEKLEVLKAQLEEIEKIANPQGREAELQRRKAELAANKEREALKRKEDAEFQALQDSQENYIRSLDNELIKLREGEAAYLDRILTDQKFSKVTREKVAALNETIEAEIKSQQAAASNAQRASQLLESLITPQEKILEQAQEIQDLYMLGLIPEDAADALLGNLQDELDGINDKLMESTEQAGIFWKVLSGTDSRFGEGREGLSSALQNFRAQAMADLDPSMSFRQAQGYVMNESKGPGTNRDQIDTKLVTVLEMLERSLSKPNDPNEGQFKLNTTSWDN